MKQLRIVSIICEFSLSIVQVKAEDQFLVHEGKANIWQRVQVYSLPYSFNLDQFTIEASLSGFLGKTGVDAQ